MRYVELHKSVGLWVGRPGLVFGYEDSLSVNCFRNRVGRLGVGRRPHGGNLVLRICARRGVSCTAQL